MMKNISISIFFVLLSIAAFGQSDNPNLAPTVSHIQIQRGGHNYYFKAGAANTAPISNGTTFSNIAVPQGTGVDGRLTFWTGTNTQSSDATLLWNNTTKRLSLGSSAATTKVFNVMGTSLFSAGSGDSDLAATFTTTGSAPYINFTNSGGTQLGFFQVGSTTFDFVASSGRDIHFWTGGNRAVTAYNSGKFGVGTSTGGMASDVNTHFFGSSRIGSTSNAGAGNTFYIASPTTQDATIKFQETTGTLTYADLGYIAARTALMRFHHPTRHEMRIGSNTEFIVEAGVAALGTSTPTISGVGLNIVKTTEQLRLAYNAGNYMATTVASTGSTTFDLVGTSPTFTFLDAVNVPAETFGSGWNGDAGAPRKDDIWDAFTTATFTATVTQSGSDTLLNSATCYGHLTKQGDIVTIRVRIELAVTSSGSTNTIYFDPPIASNFTTASVDVIGTANMDTQSAVGGDIPQQRCLVFASTADDKIGISFDPESGSSYPANRKYISAVFSYPIQ